MIAARQRQLPGFRFETQSAAPTDILPRMDVAVFVGFAASGPLHRPVRLEDVAEFTSIFGDDAPLAWDVERGDLVYAYLAPAVRAFFRNGGQSCWVIRVARGAINNHFPIPYLAQAQFDANGQVSAMRPAYARARSEGSWSDALHVSASLLSQSLDIVPILLGQLTFAIKVRSPDDIRPGDLVGLRFDDASLLMFAVKAVDPALIASSPYLNRLGLQGYKAVWLGSSWTKQPVTRYAQAYTFTHDSFSAPIAANVPLRLDDTLSPPGFVMDWPQSEQALTVRVNLDLPFNQAPQPGSLIRLDFGSDQFWLTVQDVRAADDGGTPPFAGIQIFGEGVWWLNPGPSVLPAKIIDAELLTFELWTHQGTSSGVRLSDLGFELQHARCWDALPTDEQLFPDPGTLARNDHAELYQAATSPRFPLAGQVANALSVPIAMPIAPDAYLACEPHALTALERDGLNTFGANLFLDPDLAEVGTADLLAEADFIRYQSSVPRALQGLHAAFGIEEATLIAVPDLAHRGWYPFDAPPPKLPPPSLPPERLEWWHWRACDPLTKIERVSEPEWENFLDCDIHENWVNAPHLEDAQPDLAGTFTVSWMGSPPPPGLTYTLQEAARPDFAGAEEIYTGTLDQVTLYGRAHGLYYYRVNASHAGFVSDWSNGIVVHVAPPSQWQHKAQTNYATDTLPELLRVQRALLRLCAARSDLLAVMVLPEHYREDQAVQHVDQLVHSTVDVFDQIDDRTLSFGALYHPWLLGREENRPDEFRRTPPDGAMCGIIARRTLAQGAWIAPANEALQGVVALTPLILRERRLDFLQAQVNLIRQEPRGMLALAADTLTGDPDLRSINVRRLLILLRRLAVRLGTTYVFEPHSDAFRRAVQRGFEALLEDLFARGAFAGRTTATSFQVVTDEVLNPPASVDQGKFIVELRVAPSQPMTFLTIRLVQTGDRTLVTQEW